jgi:hypothetical protein
LPSTEERLTPLLERSGRRRPAGAEGEREIGVLVLDVGPQTYDIVAAEVTDPLGNVTRLTSRIYSGT